MLLSKEKKLGLKFNPGLALIILEQLSLRGRRLKGKGKGVLGKGVPFPFLFRTPATQAMNNWAPSVLSQGTTSYNNVSLCGEAPPGRKGYLL